MEVPLALPLPWQLHCAQICARFLEENRGRIGRGRAKTKGEELDWEFG